jgi:hypothetical protein
MLHHPPRKQTIRSPIPIPSFSLEINGKSMHKKGTGKPANLEKRVSEDSNVSLVSDRSNGTPIYQQVKKLLKDLSVPKENNVPETDRLRCLVDRTVDLTCRDFANHEIPMHLKSKIEQRFLNNVGRRNRYHFDPVIPDKTEGLIPFVPLPEMLTILKAQEV